MAALVAIRQCVITLGGQGNRLKTVTGDIPKPLYAINGTSSLERAISCLTSYGINDIIFLCGYNTSAFADVVPYLQQRYECKIRIFTEPSPMGEAGGLFCLPFSLQDHFLFLNGDIIFNIDIRRLINFHVRFNNDITFVTHTSSHPYDSDCILENSSLGIQKSKTKHQNIMQSGCFLGNAGLSILRKHVIQSIKPLVDVQSKPDLFSDLVLTAHSIGLRVRSYNTTEYLKDIGTPSRFARVSEDLRSGLVERLSYVNIQRALFVDRDSTLIKCTAGSYITNKTQIQLLHKNVQSISSIALNYDFTLCITNQPQVSMGRCTIEDIAEINGIVAELCLQYDLVISGFYVCPHHIDVGFEGEIKDLKGYCFCRKPSPGLLMQAAYERNIDLSRSLFIGDSWRDQTAAQSVNCDFLNVASL